MGAQPHLAINVLDPLQPGENQLIAGGGGVADVLENRLDLGAADDNPVFKERTKKVVSGRLLIEGLRFAEEVIIHIELRRGGKVVQEDMARIRTCPWLANCNTRPLADNNPNLMNSEAYQWGAAHGAAISLVETPEFAQDGAEFGYQLRRQATGDATARKFITCLRLKVEQEKRYPIALTSDKIGTYGFTEREEGYYNSTNDGDFGGNLECLPPIVDAPYGKIMMGDIVSDVLKAFITKQKVQSKTGPIIVPIKGLGLAHVDEVLCVLSDGKILSLDWAADVSLVGKGTINDKSPNIVCLDPAGNDLLTYGQIFAYLKSKNGLIYSKMMSDGIKKAQAAVVGYQPILVPGLYLLSGGGAVGGTLTIQRSFPRNPANSQPLPIALVMSLPPQQEYTKVIKKVPTQVLEDRFFWIA